MFARCLLLGLLWVCAAQATGGDWAAAGEHDRLQVGADLVYAKRAAQRRADGAMLSAHLAFFTSRGFGLTVIDLGDGPKAAIRAWSRPSAVAAVSRVSMVASSIPTGVLPVW